MFRFILISAILILLGTIAWFLVFSGQNGELPNDDGSGGYISGGGEDIQNTVPDEPIRPNPDEVIDVDFSYGGGLITNLLKSQNQIDSMQGFLSQLYLDVYTQAECLVDGRTENALIIYAQYTQDPVANHLDYAYDELEKWKPRMIYDIGHLLFEETIQRGSLKYLGSKDIEYTFEEKVEYESSTGKKYRIYYGWEGNRLVISSSVRCVTAVHDVYIFHE